MNCKSGAEDSTSDTIEFRTKVRPLRYALHKSQDLPANSHEVKDSDKPIVINFGSKKGLVEELQKLREGKSETEGACHSPRLSTLSAQLEQTSINQINIGEVTGEIYDDINARLAKNCPGNNSSFSCYQLNDSLAKLQSPYITKNTLDDAYQTSSYLNSTRPTVIHYAPRLMLTTPCKTAPTTPNSLIANQIKMNCSPVAGKNFPQHYEQASFNTINTGDRKQKIPDGSDGRPVKNFPVNNSASSYQPNEIALGQIQSPPITMESYIAYQTPSYLNPQGPNKIRYVPRKIFTSPYKRPPTPPSSLTNQTKKNRLLCSRRNLTQQFEQISVNQINHGEVNQGSVDETSLKSPEKINDPTVSTSTHEPSASLRRSKINLPQIQVHIPPFIERSIYPSGNDKSPSYNNPNNRPNHPQYTKKHNSDIRDSEDVNNSGEKQEHSKPDDSENMLEDTFKSFYPRHEGPFGYSAVVTLT